MHIGYALIFAASLLRYGGGRLIRTLGTLVAALAFAAASLLTRAAVRNAPIALPVCDALPPSEEQAA
jgi:hypothetical protein